MSNTSEVRSCIEKMDLLHSARLACSEIAENSIIETAHAILANESELMLVRESQRECFKAVGEMRIREGEDSSTQAAHWKWPVIVIKSGWALGWSDFYGKSRKETPQYFLPEILPKIALAVEGLRFRRRHPFPPEYDWDDNSLTAGWISDARVVENSTVHANVNLLRNEVAIRGTLLAARKAGRLNLYGISIAGMFTFKKLRIEGKPAIVATRIIKMFGVDMCTEAGAGGRFLA